MEFQTLPIVGVGAENDAWKAELDSFCCHGNPSKAYKNLLKFFGDPNHAGLLGSLLFMKHQTLQDSDASGFTQMRLLADKAAQLAWELYTKLTDAPLTEHSPSLIFKTCKDRFADALLTLCDCTDCRRTALALTSFKYPGRLPKLTPHHKKCPSESRLTPLYNASLLSGWIDLDETKLMGLGADVSMFEDFENSEEMALLASILYTSYCHQLLSCLHVGVVNFIDDHVRRIVEFGSGKSGDCIIGRALEMTRNHSRGTADLHVPINTALLKQKHPMSLNQLLSLDSGKEKQDAGGEEEDARGEEDILSKKQEENSLIDQFNASMNISDGYGPDVHVTGSSVIPLILHNFEEEDESIPDDTGLTTNGPSGQKLSNLTSTSIDDYLDEYEEDFFDPFDEDNMASPEYLDLEDFETRLYMDSEFQTRPPNEPNKSPSGSVQFNPYFRELA